MPKIFVPFDEGHYELDVPAKDWRGRAWINIRPKGTKVRVLVTPDPKAPVCMVKPVCFIGKVRKFGHAILAFRNIRPGSDEEGVHDGYVIGRVGAIVECSRDGALVERWVVELPDDGTTI